MYSTQANTLFSLKMLGLDRQSDLSYRFIILLNTVIVKSTFFDNTMFKMFVEI